MRVAVGHYTGDGSGSMSITVGFTPIAVLVYRRDGTATNRDWYIKTTAMSSTNSKKFSAAGFSTTAITSLDANGFSVGSSLLTSTYVMEWMALGADAAVVSVGSYIGNGAITQNITGVGFQPDYVLVVAQEDNQSGAYWISNVGGANTQTIDASTSPYSTGFTGVVSDGFSVGSDPSGLVNYNTHHYYYLCFKITTKQVYIGSYSGNGADNRNIVQSDAFLPNFLWVGVKQTNWTKTWGRLSSMVGDAAISYNISGDQADYIQQFNSDGFQVGTALNVSSPSTTYYYLSLADIAVIASRQIPITWTSPAAFYRTFPITWKGTLSTKRTFPISWTSAFTYFYRQIPIAWTGKILATRQIPIEWIGPIPKTFLRSFPISWQAQKIFLRQLPIGWTVASVDQWLVVTNPEGDAWIVLPTVAESDTWATIPPPQSDTWS